MTRNLDLVVKNYLKAKGEEQKLMTDSIRWRWARFKQPRNIWANREQQFDKWLMSVKHHAALTEQEEVIMIIRALDLETPLEASIKNKIVQAIRN